MKYFVLSDIHGNLQALEAVLARAKEIGYERCICLGDVIGYGANPIECWDLIHEHAHITLMGNHESGIVNGADKFSLDALISIIWTGEQLYSRPDITAAMNQLPYRHFEQDLQFVHASPYLPKEFLYVDNEQMIVLSLNSFEQSMCFIGHTHQPFYGLVDAGSHQSTATSSDLYDRPIVLSPKMRCLVNVGSVGQPRDGNPNARFVMYDTDTRTLNFYEVPYDINGAQDALHRSLPSRIAKKFARRLREAR